MHTMTVWVTDAMKSEKRLCHFTNRSLRLEGEDEIAVEKADIFGLMYGRMYVLPDGRYITVRYEDNQTLH